MTSDPAPPAALAVMQAHITALNARDEDALAATMHFPHTRLAGVVAKNWATPDIYFEDFRARAGDQWARSEFVDIQVVQSSDTKVHLTARINRYDAADTLITTFQSLWIITYENGRWAARFRSSFAPQ